MFSSPKQTILYVFCVLSFFSHFLLLKLNHMFQHRNFFFYNINDFHCLQFFTIRKKYQKNEQKEKKGKVIKQSDSLSVVLLLCCFLLLLPSNMINFIISFHFRHCCCCFWCFLIASCLLAHCTCFKKNDNQQRWQTEYI